VSYDPHFIGCDTASAVCDKGMKIYNSVNCMLSNINRK